MGNILAADKDITSDSDSDSFNEINDCQDLAIEIIVEPDISDIQRPTVVKYPHADEGVDTIATTGLNNMLIGQDVLTPLKIHDNSAEKEAIEGMTNLINAGLITKDYYIKCLVNYVNLLDSSAPDTVLTLVKVIEMSIKFPYDKDLEYAILPFVNEIMRRSYNLSNDYIDAITDLYATCMNQKYFRCGRRMIKHIVRNEVLADREPFDTFLPKFTGQVLLVASVYPEYPRLLIETLSMKYSASVNWETTTDLHQFANLINLIYLAENAKINKISNTLFDTITYDITQFRQPKEALECWLTVFISAATLDSDAPHYLLCKVVNEINGFLANAFNTCETSAVVVDNMVSILMLGDEYCHGYANTILASFRNAASVKCSNTVAISLLRAAKKLYCSWSDEARIYTRIEPYILLALRQCNVSSIEEVTSICNHLMYHNELMGVFVADKPGQSQLLDTLKAELLTGENSLINVEIVYYKLLIDYSRHFAFNWTYISVGLFPTQEAPDNLTIVQKRSIIKLWVLILGNDKFKHYNEMKTTIDNNWDLIVRDNEDYMIHCIAKQKHTKKFIEASVPYVTRCLLFGRIC